MTARVWLVLSLAVAVIASLLVSAPLPACCPAGPAGMAVVNADQTVIIVWDPVAKRQHFIRQASFKSEADDFGFLIPTPSLPALDESGDEAFSLLRKVTEPATRKLPRPRPGIGCSKSESLEEGAPAAVTVLAEKLVAGFQAVVLEASSAEALVGWLNEHGYNFSPEVEAWARPYVDGGWKITALKVAKGEDRQQQGVAASALHMSFDTDRPLFPYREPDSSTAAQELGAKKRLLRIYFLADARYRGELTKANPWTGNVAWANKLKDEDRQQVETLLRLPAATLPAECWLTEFEDEWPYQVAPADLYFSRDGDQSSVEREPIIEYVEPTFSRTTGFMINAAAIAAIMLVFQRFRRRHSATPRAV